MIEIPLTTDGCQTFTISLNSERFDFRVLYNTRTETWAFDLSQGDIKLLDGVQLSSGIDIMEPYNLAIKNLVVINTEDPRDGATAFNLGSTALLLMIDDAELVG